MSETSSLRFERVYVEITDRCNLACSFCPGNRPDGRFMPEELFRKIVQQITPLTDKVCLHVLGEPLLHPRLADYIECCGAESLSVVITTNGTLLSRWFNALCNPAVHQVNVSLQAALSFGVVERSRYARELARFLDMAANERPGLYVNLRLWSQNKRGDVMDAAEIALLDELGRLSGLEIPQGAACAGFRSRRLRGRIYLHRDVRFVWPADSFAPERTGGFCHGMGTHVAILSDGTVVPCCLDYRGDISLGNCSSQSIEAILRSERASAIRCGFDSGKLVESLCRRCSYSRRFKVRQKS